jgi:hypothetical protein
MKNNIKADIHEVYNLLSKKEKIFFKGKKILLLGSIAIALFWLFTKLFISSNTFSDAASELGMVNIICAF